ncbi:MAG TPA: PfkB family carbohydrate kinase [Terriglobales bacterium]|nr:PfkB family carbohydrate kinase [Terriglobales bacterium]
MKRTTPQPSLRALLRRFPQLTLTVWGDLVADEFIAGEIARVSREAPVLILKRRSHSLAAGGGANAAANLAALGVGVRLVGVLGDDEAGQGLRAQFAAAGMDTTGVLTVKGRPTPTKTRILAHHAHTAPQQVVRLDHEPEALAPAQQQRLQHAAWAAARGSQALLVSDYGYGAATPAAAAQVRARLAPPRLVSVDARFQIADYRGLAAATPNEAELEAALGVRITTRAALEQAARRLRARLGCAHLLVTRGRDGMALFEPGRPVRHLAIHGSDQALDVTGAGDTVIAVFTAALAAGADGLAAAELANYAAGLVVMKPGTATLAPAELEAALPPEA